MRILLVSNGSRGDIYPFIALGRALKERGHAISVISIALYQSLVSDAGLPFIAYGGNESYFTMMRDPGIHSQSLKTSFRIMAKWLCLDPMRGVYQILSAFDPNTTVLVASNFMFGVRLASEKFGFPLVTICLQPAALWSVHTPPVGINGQSIDYLPLWTRKLIYWLLDHFLIDRALSDAVNEFRAEINLPTIRNIYSHWSYSPQKNIALFPRWFASPAIDWPMNTELHGFLHYDEHAVMPLSCEIKRFLSGTEKIIVITHGTSARQADVFFAHTLSAARQLGYRSLVLTLYPEQLPTLDPEYEMHCSYLSLTKVLAYCAAIVHGGGIGTIAQAIAQGIPQLLVPSMHDQHDNAVRMERLGVGLAIPWHTYSVMSAMAGLKYVVQSSEIKRQCDDYAKKIDFSHALDSVCFSIEALDRMMCNVE